MTKSEQALIATEQVLNGIEDESLSTSAALLKCLKIARLIGDTDSLVWLKYEYGGYPRDNNGEIEDDAFEVADNHGRGYLNDKGERKVFLKLASELEGEIYSSKKAINNFSTSGASVAGEWSGIAMSKLTSTVSISTGSLLRKITYCEKTLAILKGNYYDYALRINIELHFGNVATDIFSKYREEVENGFSDLSSETILKLQAIEDKINSNNPEMYSQALTTCRRLFETTAKELFDRYFPNYQKTMYKTKSGKEINISGNHYRNKISVVIEYLQEKSVKKTLVGSSILYLLDWIENLSNMQSKGVHSEITKADATKCIIHTYICLGDILSLKIEK